MLKNFYISLRHKGVFDEIFLLETSIGALIVV
jgi:hypothetical protein